MRRRRTPPPPPKKRLDKTILHHHHHRRRNPKQHETTFKVPANDHVAGATIPAAQRDRSIGIRSFFPFLFFTIPSTRHLISSVPCLYTHTTTHMKNCLGLLIRHLPAPSPHVRYDDNNDNYRVAEFRCTHNIHECVCV